MLLEDMIGKRVKSNRLTDVSFLVKEIKNHPAQIEDEFDQIIQLDVIWMNDLYEFEIGPDTIYIKRETLNEWYIYEPIKQSSKQRNSI